MHVTPLETASLWMKYALVDGLDMSLGLRHMGETWGDQENTIELPDCTLVELGLSADLGQFSDSYEGLRARINVSNVTDERYVTSCAFGRYCGFGEGRTVTASLS
ncbi:TonB-dependent receptor [Yangia pacifica]|uniref:TonB-dependent receptor n=1 Tax=Alloyangia pacifica TaxID=311180 RepID=UPI001CD2C05C|nr:TonB-dependent receptor [Alloyangia pacifica]